MNQNHHGGVPSTQVGQMGFFLKNKKKRLLTTIHTINKLNIINCEIDTIELHYVIYMLYYTLTGCVTLPPPV